MIINNILDSKLIQIFLKQQFFNLAASNVIAGIIIIMIIKIQLLLFLLFKEALLCFFYIYFLTFFSV